MTDNNLTVPGQNNTDSPFDSIRKHRPDNTEYWCARDLMNLMGYTRWGSFETPIKAAIENLEINGDNVKDHFYDLTRKSSGRDASDYELTRYAAYMVALCCDGRKPEVAGAKKYFATKTREAEVAIAQPKVPQSFAEALSLAAQQQKEIEEQAYVLLTKENEIRQMQPKVDHFDSIAKAGKWYGHETVAKCLAVAGMGQRNLMKFLRKHEYLTQNNRPCQDWINKGFAKTQFSDRGHEYAVYSIYGIGEVAKKLEAAGYAVVVQQQDMIEYDFNLPPAPRLRVLSGGK